MTAFNLNERFTIKKVINFIKIKDTNFSDQFYQIKDFSFKPNFSLLDEEYEENVEKKTLIEETK
jgi:hypothetical protein